MKRRSFTLSAASALAASSLALPVWAQAQPKEGKDYTRLGKPVATDAPAGKVEVIEVPNADDIINDYRAVVLKDAKNAEGAQKFLDLILSDSGQATLKDFGFGAPVVK